MRSFCPRGGICKDNHQSAVSSRRAGGFGCGKGNMGPGSEVAVRIGKVEGLANAGRLLYVEVAVHLDDNVSGELLVVAGEVKHVSSF